jgi:anti-anti-sigma factor
MSVEDRLQIVTRAEADRVIVELHGELDLASAPALAGELARGQVSRAEAVVLDLQDLDFVDSSGLRVILEAHEQAAERGQPFAVTEGSPQVKRLLSIAGVDEHLVVLHSADQSLAQEPR